jgi:hypothetical protein
MLPVQGIRGRPDLSMLLAGQLTGREDPSAIFDTTDRDELLGTTRILPPCSTTKMRPSSRGCVRKAGLVRAAVMKGFSWSPIPGGNGDPPSPGPVESE